MSEKLTAKKLLEDAIKGFVRPTWEQIVPFYIAVLESNDAPIETREHVVLDLMRLARMMDAKNGK